MKQAVAYLRVSTDRQEKAGNGLEAQKASIIKFAAENGYELLDIVQESASGKLDLNERPILGAALKKALKQGATLLVSKLDRLSRKASFILNLMETKVKFVVAELGEAVDAFMLHIYAVVAQKEREMISQRTKAALQAIKLKGEKQLGNPTNLHEARVLAGKATSDRSDEFANKLRPTITRMLKDGMSLNAIAREFNSNGTRTLRNGTWTATSVRNLVQRLEKLDGN